MTNRSPHTDDAARISRAARQLLADGIVGDEPLRLSGTVGESLPVLGPGGELHSWFVPVLWNDRLAAFFQFLPDGTLMRFSSFQRRPGDLTGCPLAVDWIDPARIKSRAGSHCRRDETAGEPFLTYDRSPDRIVWDVPLTGAGGKVRHLYVAGETAYTPSPSGAFG